MPVGGGGKPAGGYRAGKKGTYGCSGYPTVSADGTVHGCHKTKAQAQAQARAIWASTSKKSMDVSKAMVSQGDFVAFICDDEEMKIGRVEYVMDKPGTLGLEGSEYALEYMEEDKPLIIRLYEEEDGAWEEEEYVVYHRMSEVIKIESLTVTQESEVEMTSKSNEIENTDDCLYKKDPCWDGYVQRGMKEKNGKMVPNCVPVTTKAYEGCGCAECLAEDITCEQCDACDPAMSKAEDSYSPTSGMKSAARRALKWKEDGKATGAGTAVGWGRASDIVAGRSMSLSTVKRMYSFFSRHEVDKKGKDFYNTSNPSNGRIMWDAWGGDAGFSWSRKIVEREKAKKAWAGSAFSFRANLDKTDNH